MCIIGPKPGDHAYAEALRKSAAKFGLTILAEKAWTFDTDLRRAAPAEVPLFTQISQNIRCCSSLMRRMISAAMSRTTPLRDLSPIGRA